MDGYILLADGLRLDGALRGAPTTAVGWLTANTSVVGFQELITDPVYKDRILTFTYPEVGSIGATRAFRESERVQVTGLVVKVLSEYRSHYLAEEDFEDALVREGVPCLTGVDTRALAVRLRTAGEMAAAIAPADADPAQIRERLASAPRPVFRPSEDPPVAAGGSGPRVAVINLGMRRSMLEQLNACCDPLLFPYDASAGAVLGCRPAAVVVSDGPGGVLPPQPTVETIRGLLGKVPLLGCGLGHVALGVALGCEAVFLKRGHHGANYPVRNVVDGALEVTHQRHTALLDRTSVENNADVELLWENLNDRTVEGIRSGDGSAVGLQPVLAAPYPGAVNVQMHRFIENLT